MSTTTIDQSRPAARRRAKLSRLERSERRLGILMLVPAVLLLGTVVVYPIFELLTNERAILHLAQPWMGSPSSASIISRARAGRRALLGIDAQHGDLHRRNRARGGARRARASRCSPTSHSPSSGPCASGFFCRGRCLSSLPALIFRWFFEYQIGRR